MDAQELFLKDGRSAGVWYCGKCKRVAKDKPFIDECCTCKYCGKPIEDRKSEYTHAHKVCSHADALSRERQRINQAQEVESCEHGYFLDDNYYSDFGDVCEQADDYDNRPQWALCAVREEFPELDASRLLEHTFESLYEDAWDDARGTDELQKALDAFCAANKHLVTFSPDYTRKVRIPKAEEE